ncbi:hypothetical protein RB595_010192 [Gaeumannomyces hyphopodioides]
MSEDFSSLLRGDDKYYCNVEDCLSAEKSFDIPTDIRKHMKTHYKPVLCPFYSTCGYRGAEQKYVMRHVMTNHKYWAGRHIPGVTVTGEEFQCDICGSWFMRSDNVLKHKRTQHPEEE